MTGPAERPIRDDPTASGDDPVRDRPAPSNAPHLVRAPVTASGRGSTTSALAGRIVRRSALRARDRATTALGRGPTLDHCLYGQLLSLAVRGEIDTAGDAARLTAYQHLVGEKATDILPAGYLHILGFPLSTEVMTHPRFPLPMLGMVHIANEASVLAPVQLGTRLEVLVRPARLDTHRRGTTARIVTEITLDGEPVYHGVSTYLAKGTWFFGKPETPDAAEGCDEDAARARSARTPGDASAPTPGPINDDAGATPTVDDAPHDRFTPPLPTARWHFTPADNRAYAAVSGDHNPIHTSALAARAFGFPRRIVHGMHAAARALALSPDRGDTYDWSVTFGKPILVPGGADVVVRPVVDEDTGASAGTEVVAWNRQGAPHVTVRTGPVSDAT